jgi:hypothetical protein
MSKKKYRRPGTRPIGLQRRRDNIQASSVYRGAFVNRWKGKYNPDGTRKYEEVWVDHDQPKTKFLVDGEVVDPIMGEFPRDHDAWISKTRRSYIYEEQPMTDENGDLVLDPITGDFVFEHVLVDTQEPGIPIPLSGYNAWYPEYGDPNLRMNKSIRDKKPFVVYDSYEDWRTYAICSMQGSFGGDFGAPLPRWYLDKVKPTEAKRDKRFWGRILQKDQPYSATGVVRGPGPIIRWMTIGEVIALNKRGERARFGRWTFRDDVRSSDDKSTPDRTDMMCCAKCGFIFHAPSPGPKENPGGLFCWNCDPWVMVFICMIGDGVPLMKPMRLKDAKEYENNRGKPKEKKAKKAPKGAVIKTTKREELMKKFKARLKKG